MDDKPILAFDCAASGASVALLVDDDIDSVAIAQGRQSADLVVAINELMRAPGVAYGDLGAIVTTIGPGSFTGLRVGLATLHGFALAHPVPIKTITTLAAMAWEIACHPAPPAKFFIALRAGKGEIYVQEFASRDAAPVPLGDIGLLPETHTDFSAPVYGNTLPADSPRYVPGPNAGVLCSIAEHLPVTPLAEALPLYIRPPDAKIPNAPAWLVG